MRFEWDDEKNHRNFAKHGVTFERAQLVFSDPNAISLRDQCESEERWLTTGLVNGLVVIVVAHTIREERHEEIIRIISARKATQRERTAYEKPHEST